MIIFAVSYCVIAAIWIIKNTRPKPKRPFEYEKLIFENLGRYFLKAPLKKKRLAPRKTNSGERHKAIPSFTKEPSVVFTRIIIKIKERICPSTSINEDLAGCWSALT